MQTNYQTNLAVKESDNQKILGLIDSEKLKGIDKLEEELSRAEIIDDAMYPRDAVCLGSKVSFIDCISKKVREVIVVMPNEANVQEMKISVLTPMGSALIGMYQGGTIDWDMPNNRPAKIKVLAIRQP